MFDKQQITSNTASIYIKTDLEFLEMYNDFIVLDNVVEYGILYPYFTDVCHASQSGNPFNRLLILNVFQSRTSFSHH